MNINKLRAKALEVFGKGNFEEFCEKDPFNSQNEVTGFISKSNELYGALLIGWVNSEECTQLIYGTPKMSYPFDRAERWRFPSAKKIEVYEKIDGSNILAFIYRDVKGEQYLSYKTRLRPFVSDASRFGTFLSMWKEILERYPRIPDLVRVNRCNLSFELYGQRNKHLVEYNVPLDTALLFGITSNGNILSPRQLRMISGVPPIASFYGEIKRDYVWSYQQIQNRLESDLRRTEDGFIGVEGTVWYTFLLDGRVIQFKCKPKTIEQIHWTGDKLNQNAVIATCWNAFENYPELTFENVSKLLTEEFDQVLIDKNREMIIKAINKVNREANFRVKVLEKYKELKRDIRLEKIEVMRFLSQFFDKKDMKKVHSIITHS